MRKIIEFLRKPRWFSNDLKYAEDSPFEWADNGIDSSYYLSLLGALNGLIYHLGIVLVAVDGKKLEFRKPWF